MIDKGNGKFNMLLLNWAESQGSPIHSHSNSECFIYVLAGEVTETLYSWPTEGNKEMIPISESTSKEGDVSHMNGM